MRPKVDGGRLEKALREMGEVGATPSGGVSRLALSDTDREARDLLVSWFRELSLEVKIDPIGNIFATRRGQEDSEPVMMGSHIDTVKDAGIFDGALGVLGALEVLRTLDDSDTETAKPVAVATFTNEEGARFQPDMMGSMVYAGELGVEEAYESRDDDGVIVKQELDRIGYRGEDSLTPSCYLELHVEQGPVLHSTGHMIGVVEGVQGIAWWHGCYVGQANHAGTTPLELRRDALLGASDLNMRLRALAEETGEASVATMGRLSPSPDVINVVPGRADFTVDFRQYEPRLFTEGKSRVEALVQEVAERHRLERSLRQSADAQPVRFDKSMVDLVESKARKLGLSHTKIPSGAGHDAQFLSHVCPTAMVFVPSIGGLSHCPEERTSFSDCENGANVLLECVQELAGK
ncbi:MAG: Zn-dependent hydrolase [Candidatus Bathyarchaeota archaeon]